MSARPGEWRLELPASLEAVEEFCAAFRLWRAGACPGLNPFAAELLLREALTNSVVHGDARSITCVLRARPRRLVIAVRDQGQGFNWRASWNHQPEPWETHGRGIEIFRQYADSVRFNAKGNAVLLVKRF